VLLDARQLGDVEVDLQNRRPSAAAQKVLPCQTNHFRLANLSSTSAASSGLSRVRSPLASIAEQ
jgi:hypothetical protein